MRRSDIAIIGGGIVGLATAIKFQQHSPHSSIRVLEREGCVGSHQSGHNSGVLHSGIYYRPGSHKAQLCRAGKREMEAFCQMHHIPFDCCGKVIVATNRDELVQLEKIAARARENEVQFERIDTDRLRDLEPAVAGIAGIHVPETGIVDYRRVCRTMAEIISAQGGTVETNFSVTAIEVGDRSVTLSAQDERVAHCEHVINCGGLHSDVLYRMAGGKANVQVVPFRGEYYELAPGSQALCRNLIYPVPDPAFPFLGVHFTRMIDGGVECGPNAVLALARHGYRWTDIKPRELFQTLRFPGFQKLATKHWRMGLGEMHRSISKAAFVRALQKLIPVLAPDDLIPGRSGVRAQAITPDGKLVDDFLIESTQRATHVLNAPSPAATASLAIADHIVNVVLDK